MGAEFFAKEPQRKGFLAAESTICIVALLLQKLDYS